MEGFLGEIRAFAFGYEPQGWMACDGRLLPVNQYQALFSLLSNAYGGDGKSTFGLPDLRGRVGLGTVPSVRGTHDGAETVTLTAGQMPMHIHTVSGTTKTANLPSPNSGVFAATNPTSNFPIYGLPEQTTTLNGSTVGTAGSGMPHPNMQPFLVVNLCICTGGGGIYPPRS